MRIPCPYRFVIIQYYKQDRTTPSNQKKYILSPEALQEYKRKGRDIIQDTQCQGILLVNVDVNHFEDDYAELNVGWKCNMVDHIGMPSHEVDKNIHPLPFTEETLNDWLNEKLGYSVGFFTMNYGTH
jgi:hypothetical protein